MEVSTLIATVIGALSTAVLGLIAFRLSRQAQHYVVQRTIGDLQTAMARFRAEFPEVMQVSTTWDEAANARLYGRNAQSEAATTVRYYSYIELGLEFCNTTLALADQGRLSADVFARHYRPLVRHFLAENHPFVSYAVQGPYLSQYVRDELAAAEAEGWNWADKHERLGGGPTGVGPASQLPTPP